MHRQMKRLIFPCRADYALKYVDSDYTLDVVNDIGLTKDDLADQYQYTKDIVTDSKGVRKVQHGRQHLDFSLTDVLLQRMY